MPGKIIKQQRRDKGPVLQKIEEIFSFKVGITKNFAQKADADGLPLMDRHYSGSTVRMLQINVTALLSYNLESCPEKDFNNLFSG